MQNYEDYLEAIRGRVCSVCIDGIFEHDQEWVRCGLPKDRTCPVELYLPQVVDLVASMDSPWMEDYIDVLRDRVCTQCEQSAEGMCALRLKANCPLDTYFMLVAEAIEDAREKRRSSGWEISENQPENN